jgi:glycerol-3-phosphate dehydrogenase (NAD(P)+)
MSRVGVLGAGAWGVTLANLLSQKKNNVFLWEFDAEAATALAEKRKLDFFSYVELPPNVKVSNDLGECVSRMDFIVFVVPSHVFRKAIQSVVASKADLSRTIIISATKGIEEASLMTMSELLNVEMNGKKENIVVLSGPTIAKEVAGRMPTAITAASSNINAAKIVQELFNTDYFRVYTNTDVMGVETGGALKNVFAIAAGICDGLGLGDNTKSALITRGLREFVMLGTNMGGQASTFFGLAGLGDLIVTCYSPNSRNRTLGEKIGRGVPLSQAEKEVVMVAEGVKTARSAYKLSNKFKLEVPIIEQVYQVLYCQKPPKQAVEELMGRSAKPETLYEIGKLVI